MPKGYMLLRIARKTGIMKTKEENRTVSKKKPAKKTTSPKSSKKQNEIENKKIKIQIDEMDDDYWLDE